MENRIIHYGSARQQLAGGTVVTWRMNAIELAPSSSVRTGTASVAVKGFITIA